MDKSLYTENQEKLVVLLRQTRQQAGFTQQALADAIGEPQSFVSKIETGERRLDILELRIVCLTLGITLTEFTEHLESLLD